MTAADKRRFLFAWRERVQASAANNDLIAKAMGDIAQAEGGILGAKLQRIAGEFAVARAAMEKVSKLLEEAFDSAPDAE